MGHTGHHWDYTEHMRNGVGHVLGHGGGAVGHHGHHVFAVFFCASPGTPRGLWDMGGTACAVAWNVMSVTGGAPWRLVPRGYGLAGLTGLDAVLTAIKCRPYAERWLSPGRSPQSGWLNLQKFTAFSCAMDYLLCVPACVRARAREFSLLAHAAGPAARATRSLYIGQASSQARSAWQ